MAQRFSRTAVAQDWEAAMALLQPHLMKGLFSETLQWYPVKCERTEKKGWKIDFEEIELQQTKNSVNDSHKRSMQYGP